MKSRTLAIALSATLLGTGGLVAQTATDANVTSLSQEQMQAMMTTPQAFAERAASSNQFEILSSQLALEQSKNQHVVAFAQHMIEDHQAAGEKMVVAASS